MNKPQGMTVNYSMIVNEDGKQEIGFRYNDTDGIDIDRHYQGNKGENILNQLLNDVVTDISKQSAAIKKAQEHKAIEERRAKKESSAPQKRVSSKTKDHDEVIAELRKKLAAMEEENKSLKIDNEILNRRVKENLNNQKEEKKEPVQKNDFEPYNLISQILDEFGF